VYDEEGSEVKKKKEAGGLFGWFGKNDEKETPMPEESDMLMQSQISTFTAEERKKESMVNKEENRRLN